MSKPRWKLIWRAPRDGHKFFLDRKHPGAVAIADQSGRNPNVTDDGPLYLDFKRPMTLKVHDGLLEGSIITPLREGTPDGDKTSTFSGIMEAAGIVRRWGMEIKAPADLVELLSGVQPPPAQRSSA
jgi:hypothetical protein